MHAKVFSIQIFQYFCQILLRVCTLVLFIRIIIVFVHYFIYLFKFCFLVSLHIEIGNYILFVIKLTFNNYYSVFYFSALFSADMYETSC